MDPHPDRRGQTRVELAASRPSRRIRMISSVDLYESPILCAMPSSDATAAKRRSAVHTW